MLNDCGRPCITCNPSSNIVSSLLGTCIEPRDVPKLCVNGFACTPCSYDFFCQVTGFFIPQEESNAGDYLFLSLRQLETSEVLLSPNYDVPR
jgi:hypothetical protein